MDAFTETDSRGKKRTVPSTAEAPSPKGGGLLMVMKQSVSENGQHVALAFMQVQQQAS